MSRIMITGGQKLKGEIAIEGSKNAVLPILAATVLNGGINIIKNCPRLKDVEIMLEILQKLGCKVTVEDSTVIIDSSVITSTEIPELLAAEMRSSVIFIGPMLARCGKVTICYPGGCAIILAQYITVPIFYKRGKPSLIKYGIILLRAVFYEVNRSKYNMCQAETGYSP